VTNQTGQLEALTYGCRSYIVQKDSLVATFVREILKDHGLGAESRYMDDKTLAIQIGTSQDPNGKCIAWDCDKLKKSQIDRPPILRRGRSAKPSHHNEKRLEDERPVDIH
jgi:hypothetical protein